MSNNVRSVMNSRAARTDSPFGPDQSGFSKNITRRLVAAETTVDAATCRRMAAPSKPSVMPMRVTPRSSSSSRVRSMTLHRPTVARQFGRSASAMLIPLPAAKISARPIIQRTSLLGGPPLVTEMRPGRALRHGQTSPADKPVRWRSRAENRTGAYRAYVRSGSAGPAQPAGRIVSRGSALALADDGPRREGVWQLAQRLCSEGQQVDRVLGLDVNLIAARITEHTPHRRRHHSVTVGIAEDHHAATDARVTDEVARISPPHAKGGSLPAVIANLSGGHTNHGLPGSNVSTGPQKGTYSKVSRIGGRSSGFSSTVPRIALPRESMGIMRRSRWNPPCDAPAPGT